jgi:hypothetical protein
MRGDHLWVDVSELMKGGTAGLGAFVGRLAVQPETAAKVGDYAGRLSRLLGITVFEVHPLRCSKKYQVRL